MFDPVEAEDVIRRARAKASGASIHDVNGVSACIQYAMAAFDSMTREQDTYSGGEAPADYIERHTRMLRAYLVHGDIKRARRDNPQPGA